MISAKRLAQMAKTWQRMAVLARKRLTSSTTMQETEESSCSTSSVASKGHCVVYSADGRRFEIRLVYLSTTVFGELLTMSKEEFGFASHDDRITLPCDAAAMEYILCLIKREASEDVERAFLSSMIRPCHYENSLGQTMGISQQIYVSSF